MGQEIPKQFIRLGDLPVLMHTLLAFRKADPAIEIILVLPESQMEVWAAICRDFQFNEPHKTVPGGDTRFESVKNGLELIPDHSLVAIHDGVRPFVSKEMIINGFALAEKEGNAIPVIPLNDSIREIKAEGNISLDRQRFRLIQTPQCFRTNLLKEAYRQAASSPFSGFTDDASVTEAFGHAIHLFDGDPLNIKITYASDLIIADGFLKFLRINGN